MPATKPMQSHKPSHDGYSKEIENIVATFEGEIVSLYMRAPHLTVEDFKSLGRTEHPLGPMLTHEAFNHSAHKARTKAMKAIEALRETSKGA